MESFSCFLYGAKQRNQQINFRFPKQHTGVQDPLINPYCFRSIINQDGKIFMKCFYRILCPLQRHFSLGPPELLFLWCRPAKFNGLVNHYYY